MKLIHYSSQKIDRLEKRKYNQSDLRFQSKPNGLWISIDDAWKTWCESENYNVNSLSFSYEIVLKENADILHLKTKEDIFDFSKQYPSKTRDWDVEWDTYHLQWDEVKKNHQGIIISPYQWESRLSLESSWYYGWDCACGCIWDISTIKYFKLE